MFYFNTTTQRLTLSVPGKATYKLIPADNIEIGLSGKMPNKFHRLMQRLFFGFRYEIV